MKTKIQLNTIKEKLVISSNKLKNIILKQRKIILQHKSKIIRLKILKIN